jgi:hypothetical protein
MRSPRLEEAGAQAEETSEDELSIAPASAPVNPTPDAISAFLSVFPANPVRYGVYNGLLSNGKKKPATAINEPVTEEVVETHLAGAKRGWLSGDAAGTPTGMIDADTKNYPGDGELKSAVKRLIATCKTGGITPLIERSTTGGAHVFVFADEPVPHAVMRDALKVLAKRAGLSKFETYPKGEDHRGHWYYMPYAGAAEDDGDNSTWLMTAEGKPVPLSELAATVDAARAPATTFRSLAEQLPQSSEPAEDDAPRLDPDGWKAVKQAVTAARPAERHTAAVAVLNVARRCAVDDEEALDFLESGEVWDAWGLDDGSRSREEWAKELRRWAEADGDRRYGVAHLREQGFAVPQLEAAWDELQVLPPVAPETPPMPADLVPEPVRAYVVDVSERMNVPVEFVAGPLVTAAGSVIGRQLGVYPKAHDDWLEVPLLWCLLTAPPSTTKSPAVAAALKPLKRVAEAARKEYQQATAIREAHKRVLQKEIARLENSLTKQKNPADPEKVREQIAAKLMELAGLETQAEPRYLTNDTTTEKLAELLNANPRGLLLHADEAMRWLHSFDKHGREGDRQFYLEAWTGTQSYSVDRIGRGSLHVPALAVSVLGTTQPGPLAGYIAGAIEGGVEADGLLQRFGILIAPTRLPPVHVVDEDPDNEARVAVEELFAKLAEVGKLAAKMEADASAEPSGLRFAVNAQAPFLAWLESLEHRLRDPELTETPAFCAHLAKYRALVPRLALVFHLMDAVNDPDNGGVSLEALELAIRWAEYLEAHARNVYAAEIDEEAVAGHILAGLIKRGKVKDGATVRDIYTAERAHLKTAGQVRAAVAYLAQYGHVRLEVHGEGKPGRSREVVRLHPGGANEKSVQR